MQKPTRPARKWTSIIDLRSAALEVVGLAR